MKSSRLKPGRPPKRRTPMKRTEMKSGTKQLQSRTPIAKKSAKQAAKERARARTRKQMVEELGPWCQVRSPVCTGREEGVHHLHKAGQGGSEDRSNFLLSCNACNQHIEDRPAWAHARGLVIKSWEADQAKGAA